MWVISWKKCKDFVDDHEEAREPLRRWFKTTENAEWKSFNDVKKTFGKTADRHRKCYIFDVHGGNYRVIARVSESWKRVFVKHVLTHREYDNDDWKSCC